MCDKRFIWNPSNCECECDKACDFGGYLGYENCKRRKTLVAPLIEECTEIVEEVKLAEITLAENENSYKCSSCPLYIVLFSIFFKINVGIAIYFVFPHWYLKKDVLNSILLIQTTTYKWEKLNKLTLKIEAVIFTTIKLT